MSVLSRRTFIILRLHTAISYRPPLHDFFWANEGGRGSTVQSAQTLWHRRSALRPSPSAQRSTFFWHERSTLLPNFGSPLSAQDLHQRSLFQGPWKFRKIEKNRKKSALSAPTHFAASAQCSRQTFKIAQRSRTPLAPSHPVSAHFPPDPARTTPTDKATKQLKVYLSKKLTVLCGPKMKKITHLPTFF